MPDRKRLSAAAIRQTMYAALRRNLGSAGFAEVETPLLVPAPGMEPYITACEVEFHPETDVGSPRTLYLHTSPEYAMKRLLADGMGPIFQICKVFRNGEVSPAHNPEFTLLEFYRPHADYARIMEDLEDALAEVDPDLVEVTSTGDVVNLMLPNGIRCVLNTQRPVHQVWMAVKDQAWHFSWDAAAGRWIDDRGRGIELMAKLHEIVQQFAGLDVAF